MDLGHVNGEPLLVDLHQGVLVGLVLVLGGSVLCPSFVASLHLAVEEGVLSVVFIEYLNDDALGCLLGALAGVEDELVVGVWHSTTQAAGQIERGW